MVLALSCAGDILLSKTTSAAVTTVNDFCAVFAHPKTCLSDAATLTSISESTGSHALGCTTSVLPEYATPIEFTVYTSLPMET